jgi:hypothetical protein
MMNAYRKSLLLMAPSSLALERDASFLINRSHRLFLDPRTPNYSSSDIAANAFIEVVVIIPLKSRKTRLKFSGG